MKISLVALLSLLFLPATCTAEMQSHVEIKRVVKEFIQNKAPSMPGKVAIRVSDIDPRLALAACTQVEAFLPTGSQLIGKTTIGVRCNDKNSWSLFVPTTIIITVNLFVSSKPLQQGQTVRMGDFNSQLGELNQQGIITEENQLVGKVLKFSIGAGQILKQEMLRPPYAVTQGQTVQLAVEKQGFSLRSAGQALNNAAEGQSVQVKTPSGQVITGIAGQSGVVEVR
ncbi:MAG: flagellar basal body P-ring formation chaperone FlgA [Gallionellaceae bacterium]